MRNKPQKALKHLNDKKATGLVYCTGKELHMSAFDIEAAAIDRRSMRASCTRGIGQLWHHVDAFSCSRHAPLLPHRNELKAVHIVFTIELFTRLGRELCQ